MENQDMLKELGKKKKKKPKKDEAGDAEKNEGGDELDMSALKKKKKKKPKTEDFDAKLAEAGEGGGAESADKAKPQEGDMELGTGIWQHDETENIQYALLLQRFFIVLHDRHPDLIGASGKSHKIPPVQCLRDGNKKTIFANLPAIAKRLKRNEEHIIQFLLAEMGTSGSVDGSMRLVIKGKFNAKQIEKWVAHRPS
jgi:translation initiation factor 2 subunit 2